MLNSGRINAITIVCLVTSDCNLRCKYCYTLASHNRGMKISAASVGRLIENCSKGFDSIEFCWHGGEPLLAGKAFYESVIAAQQGINATTSGRSKFINCIQSNCLLLNDEWIEFLTANDFRIGSSFEAPWAVHSDHRPLASGEKCSLDAYCRVFRKIKQSALPLGLLCVVTKDNVHKGKEIFELFKSLGVDTYSLLPMIEVPAPTRPPAPGNEELFELFKTTFELWMNEENSFVCIEPIDTMLRSLLGQGPRLCSFASSCLKRMVSVAPDGTVLPCGSLSSLPLGNIFETPLICILHNDNAKHLRRSRSLSVAKFCGGCRYVSLCRGGCREIAFWHSGEYSGRFQYCEARKQTFAYLEHRLHEILDGKDSVASQN